MFIDFPEIHTPIQGIDLVPIPNMVTIRQSYDPTKIEEHQRTYAERTQKVKIKNLIKEREFV